MDWYNVDPHSHASINFPPRLSTMSEAEGVESARKDRLFGGVLRNVPLAWLAEDCTLRVLSLQKDETLSAYTFCRNTYNCAGIVCVEEVTATNSPQNILLAVCLDSHQVRDNGDATANYSVIAIYSVVHNCVLSCFQLPLYVTSMRFMNAENCRRSLLESFDGCLAVGTQEGQILVIDLYLNKLLKIYKEQQKQLITSNINITDCKIVDFDLPPAEIRHCYQKCLRELSPESVLHFALRIEVVDSTCAIESLLPIDLITGLAAGLEDGRLVVYDLIELQIFYVNKKEQNQMPLVKMDFLEPPDDPRACLYILALYDNGEELIAELHDLMYEKRANDKFGCYFENFLRGSKKLVLPLENSISSVISCQAISKLPSNVENEDSTSLFVISWYSALEKLNKILVFDINQWYKEEMPSHVNIRRAVCYLAGFQLKGSQCGLAANINPATIASFDSLQRCEEHFYPNSLSFDCFLLSAVGSLLYKWPGIQNKVINNLREKNATLFLEPEAFFEDIRRCRLLPQFTELNVDATFSKTSMCEVLLGVSLEHNCIGLLRDCVRSWADGSFSGNHSWQTVSTELSLLFLTNWIWKRAADIESRYNELCKGLLNNTAVSYPLDHRCKKELGAITCQLRHLADLMDAIVKQKIQRRNLDDDLINPTKHESLRLAADFRDLLLWLINIGVLPENMQLHDDKQPVTSRFVTSSIYPYKRIRDFYVHKRAAYAKINENCIKKSGSCRFLFIDAFIEHECMQRALGDNHSVEGCNTLREYWQENGGNGLYPPTTIVSMLRIMLLPNISYESKCSVLLYFFLDLHVSLNDSESEDIKEITSNLLKFSSVFRLPQYLVKNVQGFWHLDHGNFLAALDEFSSPLNNTQNYDQWLIELQVESLLIQNVAHLAIRILDAHPSLIAPTLKLKILLSNNLIAEAFHFARSKDDVELMQLFFISCLKMGNLGVVRDLALNEREGQLVEQLLKSSKLPGAENLHFVYLLQKSKYIEAVSYMDELSTRKCLRSVDTDAIDAPDLVNSAMNTMPPVTQRSTDVYFRIKNKIKQRETHNRMPVPLSCQLIKQNANNLLGGIYHSSALSAHFASCYFDDELRHGKQQTTTINPLSARNAPFLRKPQTETHSEVVDQLTRQNICYPKEHELVQLKRKLDDYESKECRSLTQKQQDQQQPSKRLRVDFEEVVSDLKRLQAKNLTLKDAGFNITVPELVVKPARECFTKQSALLSTQCDQDENDAVAPLRTTSSNGLQGILKLSTPEPTTPRKLKRGESPAIEEKTLRFTLPPNNNKKVEVTTNKDLEESQVTHKDVARTLSEESLASMGENENEKADVTQYYSMLTAIPKTDSLVSLPSAISIKDSGISMNSKPLPAPSSITSSLCQTARGRSHSPSIFGPLPRRPLTRASAEPETKLKPPSKYASLNAISSGPSEKASEMDIASEITTSVAFKMTSVSKVVSGEFAPQVCSSKVGDMKISERSTVPLLIGDSITEVGHSNKCIATASPPDEKAKAMELDTTLGMSSTDVTLLDEAADENEETNADEAFTTAQSQLKCSLKETVQSEDGNLEKAFIESDIRSIQQTSPTRAAAESEIMEVEDADASRESIRSQAGDSQDPSIELESEESKAQSDLNDSLESADEVAPIIEDICPIVVEILSSSEEEDDMAGDEFYGEDSENNDANEDGEEEDDENDIEVQGADVEAENEPQNVAHDSLDEQIESEDDEAELISGENLEPVSLEANVGSSDSRRLEEQKKLESPTKDIHLFLDDDNDDENSQFAPIASTSSQSKEQQKESTTQVEISEKSSNVIEDEKSDASSSDSKKKKNSENVGESNIRDSIEENNASTAGDLVIEPEVNASTSVEPQDSTAVNVATTAVESGNLETTVEEPQIESQQFSFTVAESVEIIVEVKNKPSDDAIIKPADESRDTLKEESLEKPSCSKSTKNNQNTSEEEDEHKHNLRSSNKPIENITEGANSNNEVTKDKSSAAVEELTSEEVGLKQAEIAETSEENGEHKKSSRSSDKSVENVESENKARNAGTSTERDNAEFDKPTDVNKDKTTTETDDTTTTNGTVLKSAEKKTPVKEKKTTDAIGPLASLESPQSSKKLQDLRSLKTKETDSSTLTSTPRNRKRGQSMPPQSVIAIEDHIETDSHTPKRRSTRGISVPPQAIDASTSSKLSEALPMTPTNRARYTTRASLIAASANAESNDSQNSPKSRSSGRSSHIKRQPLEQTGTPMLDSPALRTRSRLRTVSETGDGEGSDITQISTPSTSVRKKRRASISNKSDVDAKTVGFRGRRILLKDEEEDDGPSTSTQASYIEARRLTRTQRRLLDDQVSVTSQLSQGSLTRKVTTPTQSSVKTHDDGEDDAASVTSSAASEVRRSSRLLRSQQQHSSNPNLTAIPEQDDSEEGPHLRVKRTRAAKK